MHEVSFDRERFSFIAHGDLPVWNPVSLEHLRQMAAFVPLSSHSSILDVGCGRGQLLSLLVRQADCDGLGIDRSRRAIDQAGADFGSERIRFQCTAFQAEQIDQRFDLVLCVGSVHAIGDYDEAMAVLPGLLKPGGYLLIAWGYWQKEPDPAYLEFLDSTVEDLRDHGGNRSAPDGLELVRDYTCTVAEWDHYENSYADNVRRYLADHPEDPDHAAMSAHIESWADSYQRWGRDTLGFGVYLFRKT
ncbi:MAG: class I SAM-dependent methyltransferase [Gammaproteobacteria bacterium]|nr:class I SAM-dependent methyltransferase [Gammaproteobacteria bacterium]